MVAALDHARADALTAADPALLSRVYTDDAPARTADESRIAAMAAAGYRVSGAGHQVRSVTLLAGDDARASLQVVESLPSYRVLSGDGAVAGQTAAVARSVVVLELVHTAAGYRISRITAG